MTGSMTLFLINPQIMINRLYKKIILIFKYKIKKKTLHLFLDLIDPNCNLKFNLKGNNSF